MSTAPPANLNIALPVGRGEPLEVAEEEFEAYAKWLGLDLNKDQHLFWIARQALTAPLPEPWMQATSTTTGEIFFYNTDTKESSWVHPFDSYYKHLVTEMKSSSTMKVVPPFGKLSADKIHAKITAKQLQKTMREQNALSKASKNNTNSTPNKSSARNWQQVERARQRAQAETANQRVMDFVKGATSNDEGISTVLNKVSSKSRSPSARKETTRGSTKTQQSPFRTPSRSAEAKRARAARKPGSPPWRDSHHPTDEELPKHRMVSRAAPATPRTIDVSISSPPRRGPSPNRKSGSPPWRGSRAEAPPHRQEIAASRPSPHLHEWAQPNKLSSSDGTNSSRFSSDRQQESELDAIHVSCIRLDDLQHPDLAAERMKVGAPRTPSTSPLYNLLPSTTSYHPSSATPPQPPQANGIHTSMSANHIGLTTKSSAQDLVNRALAHREARSVSPQKNSVRYPAATSPPTSRVSVDSASRPSQTQHTPSRNSSDRLDDVLESQLEARAQIHSALSLVEKDNASSVQLREMVDDLNSKSQLLKTHIEGARKASAANNAPPSHTGSNPNSNAGSRGDQVELLTLKRDRLQVELLTRDNDLLNAKKKLQDAETGFHLVQIERDQDRDKLDALIKLFDDQEAELAHLRVKNVPGQEADSQELTNRVVELTRAVELLQEQHRELEAANTTVRSAFEPARAELSQLRADATAAQAKVDALNKEEVRLQGVIAKLRQMVTDLNPRVMIPPPPPSMPSPRSLKGSPKSGRSSSASERVSPKISTDLTEEKSDVTEFRAVARKLDKQQKQQVKEEIKKAHKQRSAGHSLLARCFGSHMKSQKPDP